ncbi:hypothetical protein SGPA1_40901 [Streptomyces misionensis JCM 4497]
MAKYFDNPPRTVARKFREYFENKSLTAAPRQAHTLVQSQPAVTKTTSYGHTIDLARSHERARRRRPGRLLPRPTAARARTSSAYETPRTPTQTVMLRESTALVCL